MLNRLLDAGGEMQSSGGHVAVHHLLQPGFMDRDATVFQDLDFFGVQIETQNVVADLGHTSPADKSDVTGADDSYFHQLPLCLNVRQ